MILEKLVIAIGILIAHFLNGSNLFEIGLAIKPDFMILLVIFFALRRGALYGLWIGFFGGLLTDSGLGGEIIAIGNVVTYKIGLHSLTFCLIGYFVGKFARSAYHENYFSITIYSLLITFVTRVATYYLFSIFFHENMSYSLFFTSFFNALIAPAFFYALTWIYQLDHMGDA
ncbi:Rod shape-determining protein MreD [Leptospira santarosai]|uniref:Rod shape-determining protein MreD n=1 Tax=Leptospira santarosai TaxID=28183 RepID=A0A2P1QQ71_9LEPT|nr:Rod shape-determining protein MreD [Leptospira santarosai]